MSHVKLQMKPGFTCQISTHVPNLLGTNTHSLQYVPCIDIILSKDKYVGEMLISMGPFW